MLPYEDWQDPVDMTSVPPSLLKPVKRNGVLRALISPFFGLLPNVALAFSPTLLGPQLCSLFSYQHAFVDQCPLR